jgi:hypothetical protein
MFRLQSFIYKQGKIVTRPYLMHKHTLTGVHTGTLAMLCYNRTWLATGHALASFKRARVKNVN